MLLPNETVRVIDTKEGGIFDTIYSQHGAIKVPETLLKCEGLRAGDKIVSDRHDDLIFAGTVRARPHGFLPFSVRISRLEEGSQELATVEVPLHYYFVSATDRYSEGFMGGGCSRIWAKLGEIMLSPGSIEDTALSETVLSVGQCQIEERRDQVGITISNVMDELLELPSDLHVALDGFNIRTFKPSDIN